MTKEQALNLLGLAQRARRLTTGETFVLGAIRDSSAKLVLVASDASANTKKKFTDKSSFYEIPLVDSLTTMELSHAIGAKRSLIAVCDIGFAKKLLKLLT
ncbi:L7Ae/L30e/S12e/Gadd45 family ribosomal protein [Lacticaseibacillus daqingensis]|uniref:L7Ae/L30e/S12e/Gadd45 family ribosomal protein n=1 Tax=Lacticaseibacillus daqingensis TaxID=2486014 RepID=UPI000F76C05A|nr:ribosomal L7Ae/L30e/S12e/Gadd45 family protein [Lacticaseibacillus daqingensis]